MLQEVLAHAHSGVGNGPVIGNGPIIPGCTLYSGFDLSPCPVVFDAVSVNIQKNLPQVQGTSVDIRALERIRTVPHRDVCLCGPLADDAAHLMGNLFQIHRLMGQLRSSVLQPANLQDIIDQRQQVVRGDQHFLVIFPDQFCILKVGHIDFDQANDAIQRRADVVAHVHQKSRFGAVCAVSFFQRLLQCCLLPELLLQLFPPNGIEPHRQQHRTNHRNAGYPERGLIAVAQESIGIFHIHFHAKGTNDLPVPSVATTG